VFITLCYLVLRRVLQLAAWRFRSNDLKELLRRCPSAMLTLSLTDDAATANRKRHRAVVWRLYGEPVRVRIV
jgi:hypothetical protein